MPESDKEKTPEEAIQDSKIEDYEKILQELTDDIGTLLQGQGIDPMDLDDEDVQLDGPKTLEELNELAENLELGLLEDIIEAEKLVQEIDNTKEQIKELERQEEVVQEEEVEVVQEEVVVQEEEEEEETQAEIAVEEEETDSKQNNFDLQTSVFNVLKGAAKGAVSQVTNLFSGEGKNKSPAAQVPATEGKEEESAAKEEKAVEAQKARRLQVATEAAARGKELKAKKEVAEAEQKVAEAKEKVAAADQKAAEAAQKAAAAEQEKQQKQRSALSMDEKNDNTDYSQKYDKDEAIKASENLAKSIISKNDDTPTAITNIIEQNQVIRSIKKEQPDFEASVSFDNDFTDIITKLADNDDKETILREFITDVLHADEITFSSEESKKAFLDKAKELNTKQNLGVQIDENKIKVEDSTLSQSQPKPDINDLGGDPLNKEKEIRNSNPNSGSNDENNSKNRRQTLGI